MLNNIFLKSFLVLFIFIIICFTGIICTLSNLEAFSPNDSNLPSIDITNSLFSWPTPNYNAITSYFGYRKAPTAGAGSFHSGIDIGAPSGANIVATFSGKVTYIGFYGANGYTIIISNGVYTATYSHISPHFLVYLGQYVNQGDVIANVGPKNVYGVPNNPYKDSKGNPTNGATTGPHLHFSIKIDGKAVNPLNYISSSSSMQ